VSRYERFIQGGCTPCLSVKSLAILIILLLPLCATRETYQAHSGSAAAVASELVAYDTLGYLFKFPLAPTECGLMGQRVQLIAHRQDLLEKNKRGMTAQQSQALTKRLDAAIVASFTARSGPNPGLRGAIRCIAQFLTTDGCEWESRITYPAFRRLSPFVAQREGVQVCR